LAEAVFRGPVLMRFGIPRRCAERYDSSHHRCWLAEGVRRRAEAHGML